MESANVSTPESEKDTNKMSVFKHPHCILILSSRFSIKSTAPHPSSVLYGTTGKTQNSLNPALQKVEREVLVKISPLCTRFWRRRIKILSPFGERQGEGTFYNRRSTMAIARQLLCLTNRRCRCTCYA